MAKKKQPPRIIVKEERHYTRVDKQYVGIGSVSTFINSSIHRFSMKNLHWQYLPAYDQNDNVFMLESVSETHYDEKGRPIHVFEENENGIIERTWIYVELEDGTLVKIMCDSDGFVDVKYKERSWSCKNGHFNSTNTSVVLTPKQKEFSDYEDSIMFGGPLTEEQEAEYERRQKEAYRNIVTDKDKYGNPLQEEFWFCDVLESFTDYSYSYAK